MDIQLKLPAWYALNILSRASYSDSFADYQFRQKYGETLEAMIEDFDEAIDFWFTVNRNMYEDIHEKGSYHTYDYVVTFDKDVLRQELMQGALSLLTKENASYTYYKEKHENYQRMRSKALKDYYEESVLDWYVDQDSCPSGYTLRINGKSYYQYTDDLVYPFKKFLWGDKEVVTVEEAENLINEQAY